MSDLFDEPFPEQSPEAIASYDFDDIAAGERLQTYYAATTLFETTTGYILTGNQATYSNDEYVVTDPFFNVDTITLLEDLDFDLSEFQTTQTFEGEGNISVTWNGPGDASGTQQGYLIFKVRKWDGSTETEIASVQTETYGDGQDHVAGLLTSLLPITIPKTRFAVGEILRLTVEIWGLNTNDLTEKTMSVRTDPVNRNGTATNPNFLKLNMPQKIVL